MPHQQLIHETPSIHTITCFDELRHYLKETLCPQIIQMFRDNGSPPIDAVRFIAVNASDSNGLYLWLEGPVEDLSSYMNRRLDLHGLTSGARRYPDDGSVRTHNCTTCQIRPGFDPGALDWAGVLDAIETFAPPTMNTCTHNLLDNAVVRI